MQGWLGSVQERLDAYAESPLPLPSTAVLARSEALVAGDRIVAFALVG